MKLHFTNPKLNFRRALAMTLVEMVVTMAILVMMMGGMIALHLFGMKYDYVATSKLGASDQARRSFNTLLSDIRSAKGIGIGTNYGTTFTNVPKGSNLLGTALQLVYARSTNVIVYYFDTANNWLCKRTNGVAGYEVMASEMTNTFIFRGEDYLTQNITYLDNHSVVSIIMEFYRYQYPLVTIGSNQLYDYYKLEFKAASRNFD
ncbi:MAG: hypothetical protein RL380_237 [Verrucomicrobiota bacterium]|jgi:type II secretory pathway pseudopilin PulG